MAIAGRATAATAATSLYTGSKQRSAQKKAQRQSAQDAEAARRQADREFNKANQKAPNVAALTQRNKASSKSGVSGTFLTGNQGAATAPGMLGRTTLLGG